MAASQWSPPAYSYHPPPNIGYEKQPLVTIEDGEVPPYWLSILEPDATGLSSRAPSCSINARQQIYRPLNANPQELEIRLLEIVDFDQWGRVSCIMTHTPLSTAPDYNALSYYWGDSSDASLRRTIVVNGFEFEVQLNLWDAMQALLGRGHRVIWVDAICLNQDDDIEKAQQVPRMRLIYQQARGVAIWLGREDESSSLFIDLMKRHAQSDISHRHRRYIDSLAPYKHDENRSVLPRSERDQIMTSLVGPVVTALEQSKGYQVSNEEYSQLVEQAMVTVGAQMTDFLARPFWRRMWIIQEVAAARSVAIFCGNDMIRWEDFAALCIADDGRIDIFDEASVGDRNSNVINRLRYKFHNRIAIGLLTALQQSCTFDAGRVQDKFYALVGLSWDADRYIPAVSYSREFTRNRIMFDMTKRWMSSGFVDIICLQPHIHHNDFQVPSWLPKFLSSGQTIMSNRLVDHLENRNPLTILTSYAHSWTATGRSRSHHHQFLDNNRILLVRGVHVDTIDGLSMACDDTYKDTSLRQVWHSKSPPPAEVPEMKRIRTDLYWALNMYKAQAAHGIPDQNVNLDYLFSEESRTFWTQEGYAYMADWIDNLRTFKVFGRPFEQWLLNRPKYRNMAKIAVLNYMVKDIQEKTSKAEHDRNILDAYGSVYDDGRRLMTTRYGRVGWAHPSARPGDRLYLLEGCNLPVILAPSRTPFQGQQTFAVVGDAYLHGCMGGQLWDQVCAQLGDVFLR